MAARPLSTTEATDLRNGLQVVVLQALVFDLHWLLSREPGLRCSQQDLRLRLATYPEAALAGGVAQMTAPAAGAKDARLGA